MADPAVGRGHAVPFYPDTVHSNGNSATEWGSSVVTDVVTPASGIDAMLDVVVIPSLLLPGDVKGGEQPGSATLLVMEEWDTPEQELDTNMIVMVAEEAIHRGKCPDQLRGSRIWKRMWRELIPKRPQKSEYQNLWKGEKKWLSQRRLWHDWGQICDMQTMDEEAATATARVSGGAIRVPRGVARCQEEMSGTLACEDPVVFLSDEDVDLDCKPTEEVWKDIISAFTPQLASGLITRQNAAYVYQQRATQLRHKQPSPALAQMNILWQVHLLPWMCLFSGYGMFCRVSLYISALSQCTIKLEYIVYPEVSESMQIEVAISSPLAHTPDQVNGCKVWGSPHITWYISSAVTLNPWDTFVEHRFLNLCSFIFVVFICGCLELGRSLIFSHSDLITVQRFCQGADLLNKLQIVKSSIGKPPWVFAFIKETSSYTVSQLCFFHLCERVPIFIIWKFWKWCPVQVNSFGL